MNIDEAFPSNFLKCADLQGRAVQIRMNYLKFEDVGDGNKPVLYFIGKEKGLVLNKTNANMISEMYGTETDNWVNQVIELYPTKADFQGKRVDAIRVRPPTVQQQPAAQPDRIIPNARQRQELPGNQYPGRAAPQYDERNPPPIGGAAPFDDEVPFLPEWR